MGLGDVIDLTDSVKPCSYEDVLRVDTILQEAAASIPSPLRLKPMAASMTDNPQIIMARLFLYHMIYKGQVVLHRRFLYPDSSISDDKNATSYSHRVCLEASLATLEIQRILDEETCPGGQLHTMRFRVTSIMNHQFLTATMILCSMFHRGNTMDRESDIRAALQQCRAIWIRRSESSKEAKKAAETVNFILARAGDGRNQDVSLNQLETKLSEGHSQVDVTYKDPEGEPGPFLNEEMAFSDSMSLFNRELTHSDFHFEPSI